MRQRKHQVKVFHWQQLTAARLQPLGPRGGLTLGTMPIAAGVVPDLGLAAVIATTGVSAQLRRTASGQRFERLFNKAGDGARGQECLAVLADNVGDFYASGSCDGAAGGSNGAVGGSTGSQSNGLVIACSRCCRTCR